MAHTIISASDAATALALARATDSLDVGIVDMVLPDGSGIELIQDIRETHPDMPIIAISGYLSDESASVRETLAALHVTRFLAKPFERHDLLSAVRNALEGAP